LTLLNDIFDTLAIAGIHLEYFHPESAQLQYEFVLPPLSPLEAVDALIQARQIIVNVAAQHGLRATLTPKPFPMQAGTASHVHMSISNLEDGASGRESKKAVELYESFYAGILKRLPAILAFSYPQQISYDRMVDSAWAGGTWISWGKQNRETALRQIEGSHWEVKVVDGLGNPYFVVAALIAAGTRGIVDKEKLTIQDCQRDPGTLSDVERKKLGIVTKLPKDLKASLQALKDDEVMNRALGSIFVQRYLNVKHAEAAMLAFMDDSERTDWIVDRY
jgi:glutamine synthetase